MNKILLICLNEDVTNMKIVCVDKLYNFLVQKFLISICFGPLSNFNLFRASKYALQTVMPSVLKNKQGIFITIISV